MKSILNSKGYTWLVLPREGVKPLTLLEQTKENWFKRIFRKLTGGAGEAEALNADLFDLFPKSEGAQLPKVSRKKGEVPNFAGQDIRANGGGVDFTTAKELKMVGAADVKAKLSNSEKLLYEFPEYHRRYIQSEVILEEYLNENKPSGKAPGFLEKLQSGRIFVVTEVLVTTKFSVKDASDFEAAGSVDAQALQGYLAKLRASGKRTDNTVDSLGYEGETPLTFALKAFRILYNKDKDQYYLSRSPIPTTRDEFVLDGDTIELDSIDI